MFGRTGVWQVVAVVVIGVLATPAAAVTVDDLDLSDLPPGTKVVQIAKDENQQPLRLCAHWREMTLQQLQNQKRVWIRVKLKSEARYAHDWVWIEIEVPPPPPPPPSTLQVIRCIEKCPRDAPGTQCVENPKTPCPVCQ